MRVFVSILVICSISFSSKGQSVDEAYKKALAKMECMLDGGCTLSFKDAVFLSENAFFEDRLNRQKFEFDINMLALLARQFIASRELTYTREDKHEVEKYAALFSIMTDTLPVMVGDTIFEHLPYRYDFNDIWGHKEWSNMFVTKLLATKSGNCHSMPYLYKIMADELDAKAHIAVAPNHFYIKHRSKANGWYNTELTSGIFPIDAWLMASGYIHLDAIVNRLYMEALNDTQSIALCIIDLAKGYQKKAGANADPEFILKCCDIALKAHPTYVNALLLQAETEKLKFDAMMKEQNVTYPKEILWHKEAKEVFERMKNQYRKIHELGYRRMPEDMYLNWLVTLKEEKSRFENTEVVRY